MVSESRAMHRMLAALVSRVNDDRITPFVVGDNMIEVASCVASIIRQRGQTETCLLVNDRDDAKRLHHKNFKTAVFTGPEGLTEDVMDSFVHGFYPHLKGVIAIIEKNPLEMGTSPATALRILGWEEHFIFDCCMHSIDWPSWSDRRADHIKIFAQLFGRKASMMPETVVKPRFDDECIGFLRELTTLTGSDHASALLNRAFERYIADERAGTGKGRLLGRHLIDADEIRQASTPRVSHALAAAAQ